MRVPPEALREDPGLLDGRGALEVGHDNERPDREAPGPAVPRRVVFGLARDLGDAEDGLPDRGVEDRGVARLDRRPLRRGLRLDRRCVDSAAERSVAESAKKQPAGHPSATAKRRQPPRTPFSSAAPRSVNASPAPATRSLTVCETRTSPLRA